MNPNISLFDLSPAEKLQLVEDLWDDLASSPQTVPIHEWQKEELDRRKASLKATPAPTTTLQQVMERVTVSGIFHTALDPSKWRQRLT